MSLVNSLVHKIESLGIFNRMLGSQWLMIILAEVGPGGDYVSMAAWILANSIGVGGLIFNAGRMYNQVANLKERVILLEEKDMEMNVDSKKIAVLSEKMEVVDEKIDELKSDFRVLREEIRRK